jgi:K+-sensing histidine kinase KdpD
LWLQVDITDSLPDASLPGSGEKTYIVSLTNVSTRMSFQQDVYAFHRVMQHKLRTPLVSILSGLELLVNYSGQLSSKESAELITGAYENATRLNDAVRDILQYVSLSKSSVKGDYFDLSALPDIVEQLRQNSGAKSIHLHSMPAKGILLSISTVAMRFIMMELLENARKFHPQHSPQVDIEIKMVDDKQILFTITDDGAGVPQEKLEQVWLPYYQGEKQFTGEIKGMGLGLATVATLIAQFNGRYRLYNKPDGNGAVVELTLPILMSE